MPPQFDEPLLTVNDICDSWGVTKAFIKNHAAYDGHPPRSLPELPAIVKGGRLYFEPFAVRQFFRAYVQLRKEQQKRATAASNNKRYGRDAA